MPAWQQAEHAGAMAKHRTTAPRYGSHALCRNRPASDRALLPPVVHSGGPSERVVGGPLLVSAPASAPPGHPFSCVDFINGLLH